MLAMLREQKRLGHEVAAIVPSLDGTIAPALAEANIPCYASSVDVLSAGGLLAQARTVATLGRLLRRLRPDVVHSHIIGAVLTTRLASWLADIPIRISGNVGPLTIESDVLRPAEIGTAFCDTSTVASCTHTRELLLRYGVPARQVELIYYAVDHSGHDPKKADGLRVRRELGIPDGVPLIGKMAYFYGATRSMVPRHLSGRGLKGHDVLIRAVPHVLRHVPEARFVLVGKGWGEHGMKYEAEMKELAKSLGVENAVLFAGERTDVPDTLASFDISVHCSLNDNLAGTVESLLMERPMVVSDIPGFADTVLHEKTGLRVQPDDPVALAEAIVRLIRDPGLARRLGRQGREWMLGRFTLDRSVADVETLLARHPQRAEQRYRLTRTFARSLAMPFRLLPIVLETRRAFRRNRDEG